MGDSKQKGDTPAAREPAKGAAPTAEDRQYGRQEPEADGANSLHDSPETAEAIRKSPQAGWYRAPPRRRARANAKPKT